MSNWKILLSGVVLLLIAAVLSVWSHSVAPGQGYAPVAAPQNATTTAQSGLANPASVNCTATLGGTLEIKDTATGQVGVCHLKDGRACEEWALYRDNTCTAVQ